MLAHYFPAIALIMLPFGLSVAASRVILGLHYPTDVLVGAFIGWVLAQTSLQLAAMPWT
jgi:undecaprenyl-diphosphatase